jgi:single-strand DNA-binding protein
MSISVTGKLNKPANEFQAGASKGFGFRLGVKFYNRETKEDEWTNYEAVVFAKEGAQANFYKQVLVKGSIVEVSGSGCHIRTFNGNNGPVNSIAILDAKLGFMFSTENSPSLDKPADTSKQDMTMAQLEDDLPF